MQSLIADTINWVEQKEPFTIARVIKTWGASPRPIGSALLVNGKGEMQGSVSGGCVEGAVVHASLPLLGTEAGKWLKFGVSHEEAWSVGLSCGGTVEIFATQFMAFSRREREQAVWEKWKYYVESNEPCVLLTHLHEHQPAHALILPNGTVIGQQIPDQLVQRVLQSYQARKNEVITYEGEQYFVHLFPRKSQLLIIGAAHITASLVQLAKLYDFDTTVIDPRGFFVQGTQFAAPPDRIITSYPAEVLQDFALDAYTYAVILSHDPKIDDNALHILLQSEVGYIGALGSKRTHAKRVKRLEEAGFSEHQINRIHAPIGVDIRAKTPQEIALSVMGEIILEKNAHQ